MNQHNLVTRTTEVPFQHIPCFYDGLSVISGPAARKILRNKTQEHDRLLPPLLAPLKSPQHDSCKELTPPSVYAPPASVLCNVGSTAGPLLRTLRTFFSALSKLTSYYKDFCLSWALCQCRGRDRHAAPILWETSGEYLLKTNKKPHTTLQDPMS